MAKGQQSSDCLFAEGLLSGAYRFPFCLVSRVVLSDHMILRGDSKELLEFVKSVDFNKTIKEIGNVTVKVAEVLLLNSPCQEVSFLLSHDYSTLSTISSGFLLL